MNRFRLAIVAVALLVSSSVSADDAKLDTLLKVQKDIYDEVLEAPLTGKNLGLELNLFRLLFIDEETSLSGGFSLFNISRTAEVAFPWLYAELTDESELKTFTVDAHYRQFLGKHQNGIYLSGFTRFAILNGADDVFGGDNIFDDAFQPDGRSKDTVQKLGIGFGLGWRRFSERGLYWGTSLSFGRYLVGKNNRFRGDFLGVDNDDEAIFDMEFLKFGWAF